MHYALIAAGEGSRLREEGIDTPKPLVKIQGEPMIGRLIRVFMQNGAQSISVICNEQMIEVQRYLESLRGSDLLRTEEPDGKTFVCPLNIVIQTTASSMHSLAALKDTIPDGKFCLTTVDTIFQEQDFSSFIRAFAAMDDAQGDGLFAVTPFVDDEKPLWVGIQPQKTFTCACDLGFRPSMIVGFYDHKEEIPEDAERMVSGGIYCLNTLSAFPILQDSLASGKSRMRNYQRALISAGLRLRAFVFHKIMDIDHASDIAKAERWVSSSRKKILAVSRDAAYSPNNVEKDAAIWQTTISLLRQNGYQVEECTESDWQKKDNKKSLSSDYFQIIHMARRCQSLDLLQQVDIPVLNSSQAVRIVAKSRAKTLSLLHRAELPVSDWTNVYSKSQCSKSSFAQQSIKFPSWLKVTREGGAQQEDVCFVSSLHDLKVQLESLEIDPDVIEIIATPHIEGEIIKCYAVLENETFRPRLFRWFRPLNTGYSKFGEAESHNVSLQNLLVDEEKLRMLAQRVGQTVGLQVLGFDLIIQSDGGMSIIDVNDWPSFSSCREVAAEAIASVVCEMQNK